MFYWFAFSCLSLLSKIFCPFKVYGRQHIPSSGSFILASNHLSNLDPFLVGLAVQRRISYMAKDVLFKNKILAFLLKKVETFPVHRDGGDIKALRESLRRLKAGSPLLLFPTGTRMPSPGSADIKAGIGFLVTHIRVPVVPVRIIGSDHVLPRGARRVKRHPIDIVFGEAMTFSGEKDYSRISAEIMARIQALHPQETAPRSRIEERHI